MPETMIIRELIPHIDANYPYSRNTAQGVLSKECRWEPMAL